MKTSIIVSNLLNQLGNKIWSAPGVENVSDLDFKSAKAIYYDGLDYNGKPTKVFAYVGYPEGLDDSIKLPAVVCAHGGGGTAFADWVIFWNNKGYAAISMDLEGSIPSMPGGYAPIHQQYSGPSRDGTFGDANKPIDQQWTYHAIADVIIANSLLREDPRIDSAKIGLTGISWGGVISSIVMGLDNRFAFAVPVYGCGYLEGQKNYFGLEYTNKPKTHIWEPSNFIKYAGMPVLWLNDDLDMHFPAVSSSLSYENTKSGSLCLKNGIGHGHTEGWSQDEIYAFADSIVKNGQPLIKIIEQPTATINHLKISLPTGITATNAWILYTIIRDIYDEDSNCIADWQIKSATINGNIITFEVPLNAKAYYIVIKDSRNLQVSSKIIIK